MCMGAQPEQNTAQSSSRHVPALDGIRGTAILLVLLFHLLWSNSETGSRIMNAVVALRGAGWVGVDLFYALSGFLITGILFDSLGGAHYFRNFYVRRVLRIVPLYYGVATLLFLLVEFKLHEAAGRPFALLLAYLNNTPLWWHTQSGKTLIDLTNHLWSLAVEEQFYLVWPFVVFAVRDRRKLMGLAVLLALSAPAVRMVMIAHGASVDALYKSTICRADSLLGGAWVALAMRGGLRERLTRWAPAVFLLGLTACLVIGVRAGNFDYEVNPTVRSAGFSLVALTSAAWVAMMLRAGVPSRLMSARWLRFFGRYSYGIYVLHMPVEAFVQRMLAPLLRAHLHSKAGLHLVELALTMGITLPTAMASFRFYETPFLNLKRYFGRSRKVPLLPGNDAGQGSPGESKSLHEPPHGEAAGF